MNNDKIAGKCPMELALELISRKWVIQILRDMFFGKKRFNEFKDGKPNLSNKVLSNCLKEMEENGLITRNSDKNNQSIEYTLTDKGSSLKLDTAARDISEFASRCAARIFSRGRRRRWRPASRPSLP